MLSKEILDLICCPECYGDLDYSVKENLLRCKKCARVYRVEDDIPILLKDEKKASGSPDG